MLDWPNEINEVVEGPLPLCEKLFGFLWHNHHWDIVDREATINLWPHGCGGYLYWRCIKCGAKKKTYIEPGP